LCDFLQQNDSTTHIPFWQVQLNNSMPLKCLSFQSSYRGGLSESLTTMIPSISAIALVYG